MDDARATGSTRGARDQNMVNQSAADHDDNLGSVVNCINISGRFLQSAVSEFDGPEAIQSPGLSGTREAERPRYGGRTANNYGEFAQSAVPDVDGLKLGNEVKAEIHDVWRDRTEGNTTQKPCSCCCRSRCRLGGQDG